MPRDYKPKTTRKRKSSKKAAPGWLWLVTGLAVGLFVSFLVHLYNQNPQWLQKKAASTTATTDARAVKKSTKQAPPPPKRYDFYTMLPEMEVVVPEDSGSDALPDVKPVQQPGTYVLQVGSFRQYQDADRLKAELALSGFVAHIQKVTINNDATWHRVRLGPFKDLDKLNTTRAQLKANNIKAILLKLQS